ncbi:MAG: hypothetical protein U1E73_04595 [Planctomycetota bacterium]
MTTQKLSLPAPVPGQVLRQLAYLEAYDAVIDCDYAFLAWLEVDGDGQSRVRIKSSQTAGAVFEAEAMARNARSTGARGEPWFQWGYSFDPSPSDPRCIRFRVLVEDGKPAAIEMFVQLRNADGAAGTAHAATFDWPLADACA